MHVIQECRYSDCRCECGVTVKCQQSSDKLNAIVEEAAGRSHVCMTLQVFDSGLLGEGVLHMLAAAKQKLLQTDASLVPAAATVFCQALQMRADQVR